MTNLSHLVNSFFNSFVFAMLSQICIKFNFERRKLLNELTNKSIRCMSHRIIESGHRFRAGISSDCGRMLTCHFCLIVHGFITVGAERSQRRPQAKIAKFVINLLFLLHSINVDLALLTVSGCSLSARWLPPYGSRALWRENLSSYWTCWRHRPTLSADRVHCASEW